MRVHKAAHFTTISIVPSYPNIVPAQSLGYFKGVRQAQDGLG